MGTPQGKEPFGQKVALTWGVFALIDLYSSKVANTAYTR